YKKNGFEFLFSTEDQEKQNLVLEQSQTLKTRLMVFDLIKLTLAE
ncbi:MAG: N-acetyltransferase, partial [Crocinitomicaceae bacterium]|nr:N-acetyltransferase [Crocinitomicaceae bacterium]